MSAATSASKANKQTMTFILEFDSKREKNENQ
jgi:hypothetical protein